jgi:hypothetical protein
MGQHGGAISGAASGAAAGTQLMPGWGTAIGGAVGLVGGMMSDQAKQQQIDALGNMGTSQLSQEQQNRQQALGYATPTPQEIQTLQQQLAVSTQQVQQGQQLVGSYSPAVQAAGNQALALMNGQSAASLAPMMNQRAQQRAQLQQQLQQQLGSGYQTSSAGIQALNNFDQQTSNLTAQVQQQAIGQYMGYAGQGAQLGSGLQEQGNVGLQNNVIGNQRGQQMQIGALTANPVNPAGGYIGQYASGGNQANTFGALIGAAPTIAGLFKGDGSTGSTGIGAPQGSTAVP